SAAASKVAGAATTNSARPSHTAGIVSARRRRRAPSELESDRAIARAGSQRQRRIDAALIGPAQHLDLAAERRQVDAQRLELDAELGERLLDAGGRQHRPGERDLPGVGAALQLGREVDRVAEVVDLGIEA